MLRPGLLVVLACGVHAGYIVGTEEAATTCSGHFNAPCANYIVNSMVNRIATDIGSATDLNTILARVTSGGYNLPINFWPWIVNNTNGVVLASGRRDDLTVGSAAHTAASAIGQTLGQMVRAEGGIDQPDVLSYMRSAPSNNDGYFEYVGWDNYHQLSAGVRRIGVVRLITPGVAYEPGSGESATSGELLVAAAFSDQALTDTTTEQPCASRYSELCSFAYTRRMVGEVTTAFLRVRSQDAVEQLFADLIRREFNRATGFYPFMYSYDCAGACEGNCVAHGVNPRNPGRTLMGIIDGAAALRDHVNGTELHNSFVQAANNGGGFVGYMWYNPGEGTAYLKVAYITGIVRFGVKYYIGVGFNHAKRPPKVGPYCTPCNQNYNYPCAWANTLALLGHCQSALAMTNRCRHAPRPC